MFYKNPYILKAIVQGDYKLCKRLCKFIGKKATATQKLNAHHST
jgi:hypothetical protein